MGLISRDFRLAARKDAFPHVMRPGERLRTTMCASVMKVPSTVSLLPWRKKRASSVLTLTPKSGAEKKL